MAQGETYQQFIEKFKPKKTTDDCYTPPYIYETILKWVKTKYNIPNDATILRPFKPGGNYQTEHYDANTYVIDNPPFSIRSQILKYYNAHNIKYFLFAPALTQFSTKHPETCHIISHTIITYENGAKVNTSFDTNLDPNKIAIYPDLNQAITKAIREHTPQHPTHTNTHTYPTSIITSATLQKLSTHTTQDFTLTLDQLTYTRQLDQQKQENKTIYGGGYLLTPQAQQQYEQALKKAKHNQQPPQKQTWQLTPREEQQRQKQGGHHPTLL